MKRNLKISIITGAILCVIGIAGAAPTVYFSMLKHSTASAEPAFPTPKTTAAPASTPTKPVISGHPVSISIPSVNVTVPVVDGQFDAKTKEWTLGLHTAHWGVMTPQPNDTSGNTYIYGHYRPEVFAYLHNIKPGAQAIVTTDNGYTFTYTFESSVTVDPNDTSLFSYQGPSILTVQTCSGSWFQNRTLYKFTFTSVEKS
ncbi:MAG TPA: sortase [Candidatus Saccharimonadales bacterium]|nr:sortase [Candidatus Saccharimonadales bacterium]